MKKRKGMQITMGIALALILLGLVNLGVYTFHPSPSYDDYCEGLRKPLSLEDSKNNTEPNDLSCYDDYDKAREDYDNQIFYVYVIIGLILTVTGLFIVYLPFQIVGVGAGTALIIEGILRNLENKIPAFIAGVIVFGILSYFVWKKMK